MSIEHDVFVQRHQRPDHAAGPVPNPPVIDWPFWYQFGAPGPLWGCDAGTPPVFDTGDSLLNNSVPTVFNLTPSTSYTCKNLVGRADAGTRRRRS